MSEKSLEELEFEETGVTRKEQWKAMWASIVGYAMDGLDVLILSFAMAAIVAEFGLTLGEGGLIATYTLIGTVLGGYLFGVFADYFGRVHTFALTIIIFSIFTGACAFADNVHASQYPSFLRRARPWRGIRDRHDAGHGDLAGSEARACYGGRGDGLAGGGCTRCDPGGCRSS